MFQKRSPLNPVTHLKYIALLFVCPGSYTIDLWTNKLFPYDKRTNSAPNATKKLASFARRPSWTFIYFYRCFVNLRNDPAKHHHHIPFIYRCSDKVLLCDSFALSNDVRYHTSDVINSLPTPFYLHIEQIFLSPLTIRTCSVNISQWCCQHPQNCKGVHAASLAKNQLHRHYPVNSASSPFNITNTKQGFSGSCINLWKLR